MFSIFKKKNKQPKITRALKTVNCDFQVDYLNGYQREGQLFTSNQEASGQYCKGRKIKVGYWKLYVFRYTIKNTMAQEHIMMRFKMEGFKYDSKVWYTELNTCNREVDNHR